MLSCTMPSGHAWSVMREVASAAAACFVRSRTLVPCKCRCLRQNKWTPRIYFREGHWNSTGLFAQAKIGRFVLFGFWRMRCGPLAGFKRLPLQPACSNLAMHAIMFSTENWLNCLFVICFDGQIHRMLNMLHSRANGMCVKKVKASKGPKLCMKYKKHL